jgi:kumamolisin
VAGERTEIAGSTVARSEAVRRLHPADPNKIVEATIVIRRPAADAAGESNAASSGRTRDEIAKSLSADPSDISAVTDFAHRFDLAVVEASPAKRMVRVKGTVQNMNRAFGTDLAYFEGAGGTYLSYEGPLTVDPQVAPSIMAVLGLHQEPVARPRAKA